MNHLPEDSNVSESSSLAVIADSIGVFLGKVPASLQRNVAQALGHLFKVPNAYLDGLAEEIKATSEARAKITKAAGAKLAQSISVDSSLAQIATQTHARKILRQQKNAVKVLKYAAEDLTYPPGDQNPAEPEDIDEDWLNAFESEAVNMSSEQMQKLFGKMLAGEIRRPSTFSIRTVKLMGQMDIDVAEIFRRFCSIVSSVQITKTMVVDGRAISFNTTGSGSLHIFGIPHREMLTLEEYGLISDINPTKFPYDMCIFRKGDNGKPKIALTYNQEQYVLVPKAPKTAVHFETFDAFGIALSRVGRELLSVVELDENRPYTEAMITFFDQQGLLLFPIPGESEK